MLFLFLSPFKVQATGTSSYNMYYDSYICGVRDKNLTRLGKREKSPNAQIKKCRFYERFNGFGETVCTNILQLFDDLVCVGVTPTCKYFLENLYFYYETGN